MPALSFPLSHAFLALPLEGDAREHCREVQNRLRDYEDLFRFQNPETPHLSLYFWQTLMEIEHGQIVTCAEKIAGRTQPFTLEVTGAGTFEGEKIPRVLFLTIARSEELARLKKLCPWPNLRPFAPHITLARMKNPHAFRVHEKKIRKPLKDVSFEIPCDRLRLYAEIEGVKQTPIRDFPFLLPSLSRAPASSSP